MNLDVRFIERLEEPEPLDMIHVQMREQQVDPPCRSAGERAEAADPGTRVEHKQAAVVIAHLHARGVTAVARRFSPGAGQRAARAPDRDLHYSSQKSATAPRCRPA